MNRIFTGTKEWVQEKIQGNVQILGYAITIERSGNLVYSVIVDEATMEQI